MYLLLMKDSEEMNIDKGGLISMSGPFPTAHRSEQFHDYDTRRYEMSLLIAKMMLHLAASKADAVVSIIATAGLLI